MTTYYDRIADQELAQAVARLKAFAAQLEFDAWLRFQRARQGSE